jgi:hypothetical protein
MTVRRFLLPPNDRLLCQGAPDQITGEASRNLEQSSPNIISHILPKRELEDKSKGGEEEREN